jgi:hypothetical protein
MILKIETREAHLTARNAAQFLNALVVLREGLALAVLDQGTLAVEAAIGQRVPDSQSAKSELLQAGRALMRGAEWPEISLSTRSWVTYSVLRNPLTKEQLELNHLEAGSLSGILRDLLKGLGGIIHNILSAANDLLPGNDGKDFASALRGILLATQASPKTLYLAAGMCVLAAEDLRLTLAALDAESIGVEADVEVGV